MNGRTTDFTLQRQGKSSEIYCLMEYPSHYRNYFDEAEMDHYELNPPMNIFNEPLPCNHFLTTPMRLKDTSYRYCSIMSAICHLSRPIFNLMEGKRK